MIRLSINLPIKRRLDLTVIKRRNDPSSPPLLPSLRTIKNTRSGNKVSRFFRHIFEQKRVRKIFGTNLALTIFVASLFPTNTVSFQPEEEANITKPPIILSTEKGVQYPVKKVIISQGYKFYHPGIDLDGVTGDPVYPIMSGIVEAINYSGLGYGNAILINHGNKITSLYAHLSKILVSPEQEVTKKTEIGQIGSTGFASGDHLHLEIRDNGHPFNPLTILP